MVGLYYLTIKHFFVIIKTHKECDPAIIYLFKVNNRNTRKRCKICSKLTIKTPEHHHYPRSVVFVVKVFVI